MTDSQREIPDSVQGFTRRRFVAGLALSAGAVALGVGGWAVRDRLGLTRPDATPAPAEGVLGEAELQELEALATVLFPPEDPEEGAELAQTVRWWAAGRSGKGPHLPVYRQGLAALEAGSGGFLGLGPDERASVVGGLMGPGGPEAFRTLAGELLQGIYASAPGWRSLGYTTWPGVASAPGEYTRRPGPPRRPVSGGREMEGRA